MDFLNQEIRKGSVRHGGAVAKLIPEHENGITVLRYAGRGDFRVS